LILWPLYLAAQTSTATVEIRRGAAGGLEYVAETMGIRQAAPPYVGFAKEVELVDSVAGEDAKFDFAVGQVIKWNDFMIRKVKHNEFLLTYKRGEKGGNFRKGPAELKLEMDSLAT
jgi:hypothetical protein